MLLSMSKQFFTARLFTHSALNDNCIEDFPLPEGASQLLSFHTIEYFGLSSPAMDGRPVYLSQSGFSVGSGGILSKSEWRGWPGYLCALHARDLPATSSTFRMSLRCHLRPRHKEEYDERCKTESWFPFYYQIGRQL